MPDLVTKNNKIDKRTKNGKKLDLAEVMKLKEVNGLSYAKIGSILGYNESYIYRAYEKFKDLIQDTDTSKDFTDNRIRILSSLELNMLQDLSSKDKRSKASLNNTAFAFSKIHDARRLEEGKGTAGGVTVNIEIAYQEASALAKELRLKHAGTGSTLNQGNDNDIIDL